MTRWRPTRADQKPSSSRRSAFSISGRSLSASIITRILRRWSGWAPRTAAAASRLKTTLRGAAIASSRPPSPEDLLVALGLAPLELSDPTPDLRHERAIGCDLERFLP